jgi:hypothetical protein
VIINPLNIYIMKNYMFYLAAFLFVFTSCEKEAMEPEVMNAQFQIEEDPQKAHVKNVQSFKAHLTGDQEVPDPVDTQATGQTNFKLSKDGNSLSYKLIVANIENVAAAHIHIGERGANGGVAVTLYNGPIEGRTSGVLAEGMITSAAALSLMTLRYPERLINLNYPNVS